MSDGIQKISCGECGQTLEETQMLSADERLPCPCCGSMKRHVEVLFTAAVKAEAGMRAKGKSDGIKKPFVEIRAEPSTRKSTGDPVFHERTINRREDRYTERVTLKESGEVIHECNEKLSDHTGHGSARIPKKPTDFDG